VKGLKDGEGATVFDFERVLAEALRELLAEAMKELPPPPEMIALSQTNVGLNRFSKHILAQTQTC